MIPHSLSTRMNFLVTRFHAVFIHTVSLSSGKSPLFVRLIRKHTLAHVYVLVYILCRILALFLWTNFNMGIRKKTANFIECTNKNFNQTKDTFQLNSLYISYGSHISIDSRILGSSMSVYNMFVFIVTSILVVAATVQRVIRCCHCLFEAHHDTDIVIQN